MTTALHPTRLGKHYAWELGVFATLGLAACQADMGTGPDVGTPAGLEVAAGSGQSGRVGQALPQPVVVRVTDARGHPVAGVPVTFAAGEGGGTLAPETSETDEEGEARAVWTLGSRSGPASATAASEGLLPATVVAEAFAGDPARLGFRSIPRGAVAGIAFDPPVTVAIEDQYGNRVPDTSAQVRLKLTQGSLEGSSTVIAVDGIATFPGLRIDAAGTGYVLSATAEGLTAAESGTFPVATGVPAELLAVAGDGQVAAAGSAVAVAPTVVVRDAEGNGVAGVSVSFTVTAGGGSVAPGTVVTAQDGQASPVSWALGGALGTNTLRAEAVALPGVFVELGAEAVPGPVDPARSTLTASPGTVVTGAGSVLAVTARDAFGNPVPGAEVLLGATGQGNTLVQPPATGGDGTASGSLSSTAAGIKTVTAVVGGVELAQQATVVVESPPEVAEVIVAPAELALLEGGSAGLTAAAVDADGHPVPGATVTWSSSDPDVASVDAGGTVTALAPGSATVTAVSDGRSGTAQVTVSYGEGTLTDVTYCTMGDVALRMDVYLPDASRPRPLPVAVHVHGGGWVSGSKSSGSRFTEVKTLLLQRGYLVASLDYRLAPAFKYPAQVQDVKCAIRHLRARASRYGLDPGRIGVWGGSAGGQLVALLGTADASAGFDGAGGFQNQSSEVQAVIAISAITDFTHPEELLDDYHRAFTTWPDPTSAEMIEASPVTHVSSDDAPFFFIVADEDELVMPAQSERLSLLLNEAGVPASLLRVLHADHALEPTDAPIEPTDAAINSRMADFFDQHLR